MSENNTNNPLISIVIPCYKCANTLEECVKSLVDSYNKAAIKNFIELILIEDGSPDNGETLDKCIKLTEQYHNDKIDMKVVQHPQNMGLSAVRNTGIEKSNGRYITFIDSDDTVDIKFFDVLLQQISQDDSIDIFIWGLYENYINSDNKTTKTVNFVPEDGICSTKNEIMNTAIRLEEKTLLGYAWNKLYRVDFVKENKLNFKECKLIEDIIFNISAFDKAKTIRTLNYALHNYKRRDDNETSKNKKSSTINASVTNEYYNDYFDLYYQKVEALYKWYETNNFLDQKVKTVLANEYSRYSFSAFWRNKNSKSGMSKDEQKQWIADYFNLEMTKKLINYINPEGKLAKQMGKVIQSKDVNKIYHIAGSIEFVTDHFTSLLNKLRQSR